jgi:SAM-dependent methyltransferase
VWELIQPQRVLDVGCGRGAWLLGFCEVGADVIQGIDGDYVDLDALLIPRENFVSKDLMTLTGVSGKYDLAICLEVLEHLPPQSGRRIIVALTEAAPVVLFSAAVPGQGGTGHVNEQWPEYWIQQFEARGYRMLDLIRPRICKDNRVAWWYRQNIVMFVSEKAICGNERLKVEASGEPQSGLEWVHISMVRKDHGRNAFVSIVSNVIPVRLKRHIRRPIKIALAVAHVR